MHLKMKYSSRIDSKIYTSNEYYLPKITEDCEEDGFFNIGVHYGLGKNIVIEVIKCFILIFAG